MNKKGFVSVTFLALFLVLDTVLAALYYQLAVSCQITAQLVIQDERTARIILAQRWLNRQLEQTSRCQGWQSGIQAEVSWQLPQVEVITEEEKIVFQVDENTRKVTDYAVVR